MKKDNATTRISLEMVKGLKTSGQSNSDWKAVQDQSESDLDQSIASCVEEGPAHFDLDWTKAVTGIPAPKAMVNLRLDPDVLKWFRKGGKGYQTRINAVLRAYVEHQAK